MSSVQHRFEDVDSAFAYIEAFTNLERRSVPREYRLDRMQFLLDRFGRPEAGIRFIHVAGSKGKGSTATFIAAALSAAGVTAGLYRSPHVESYRERITVAGTELPDPLYIELVEEIRDEVERIRSDRRFAEWEPTTFELLTLMAFLAFRKRTLTWAVLETGIGGRLDATNVVVPEASVLTPIELEHTDILGTTISEIAAEKAGIIKAGAPVFSSAQPPEAEALFRKRAEELGSRFIRVTDGVEVVRNQPTTHGTSVALRFADGTHLETRLRLIGAIQAENAALAALVVRSLFPEAPPDAIGRTLGEVFLPGRMEMAALDPDILLDGAHTPSSIEKVIATFRRLYPARAPQEGVLLFAAVEGKRQEEMARLLAPEFDRIFITTPGFFKPSRPEDTLGIFRQLKGSATLVADPAKALNASLAAARGTDPPGPVLVTGSFYLVAEVRKLLRINTSKEAKGEIAS
ncbi:bifunctional folylpolyglutamate synthase/dihydrofolate synthase [Salinispira pacifica]